MALVRMNVLNVRPESALSIALDDFRSILTEEQRTRFVTTPTPDANAAVRLATEIDRENVNRTGRCLGVRLLTFLESVNKFSNIVDTFVSTNPQIAGLVWGSIKLTLLVANNFISYFDKLSDMFMQLGRTCPRLAEFGSIYLTSTRLQRALCEYYAVVVSLCKSAVEFSRKPVISQAAITILRPFELQFGPQQKKLMEFSQDICGEISLAAKKAQDQESKIQAMERKEASRYRASSKLFQDQLTREQLEAKQRAARFRVLNLMSMYDYQKTWKQAPFWALSSASIIADLLSSSSSTKLVSYFFCRFDEAESTVARTIIGGIARQLLNNVSHEVFTKLDRDIYDNNLGIDRVLEILSRTFKENCRYFIIIDGIDECKHAEIQQVFEFLKNLLSVPNTNIKVYYTCRLSGITWVLPTARQWQITIDPHDIEADIDHFIQATLDQKLEDETLRLRNPKIILTIQKALMEKTQGMFLWAAFQIENISAQRTDHDMIEAIQDLPEDLPRTFERILKKLCQRNDARFASKIFDWLTVAKRPLMLEELREAIAVIPPKTEFDAAYLVNDMTQTLACCGCLVVVDEEQETVHFTHHSVKQYLSQDCSDPLISKYHVDVEAADKSAGDICITYLSFGVFDRRVAKASISEARFSDIPAAIVRQQIPYSKLTNKIAALAFLSKRDTLGDAIHRQLGEITGKTQQQYCFLVYAQKWWITHTKHIEPSSRRLWELWCGLLVDQNSKADKPWSPQGWSSHDPHYDMSSWAISNDHIGLLIHIFTSGTSADWSKYKKVSYLTELARLRRWRVLYVVLDILWKNPLLDTSDLDKIQTELLAPAAWFDQISLFQLCVTELGNVHMTTHHDVLKEKFNMNFEKMINGQPLFEFWSPLALAATAGHIRVVEYIMARPHSAHEFRADLPQALVAAAGYDNVEVVRYLLSLEEEVIRYASEDDETGQTVRRRRFFDHYLKDSTGQTAVDYLAARRHYELVRLLRPTVLSNKYNTDAARAQ
ncbi:hypothetical protein MMC17_000579 [Xylographa soralifera]|nr:hypothetical protein [Xylographa soralifera]